MPQNYGKRKRKKRADSLNNTNTNDSNTSTNDSNTSTNDANTSTSSLEVKDGSSDLLNGQKIEKPEKQKKKKTKNSKLNKSDSSSSTSTFKQSSDQKGPTQIKIPQWNMEKSLKPSLELLKINNNVTINTQSKQQQHRHSEQKEEIKKERRKKENKTKIIKENTNNVTINKQSKQQQHHHSEQKEENKTTMGLVHPQRRQQMMNPSTTQNSVNEMSNYIPVSERWWEDAEETGDFDLESENASQSNQVSQNEQELKQTLEKEKDQALNLLEFLLPEQSNFIRAPVTAQDNSWRNVSRFVPPSPSSLQQQSQNSQNQKQSKEPQLEENDEEDEEEETQIAHLSQINNDIINVNKDKVEKKEKKRKRTEKEQKEEAEPNKEEEEKKEKKRKRTEKEQEEEAEPNKEEEEKKNKKKKRKRTEKEQEEEAKPNKEEEQVERSGGGGGGVGLFSDTKLFRTLNERLTSGFSLTGDPTATIIEERDVLAPLLQQQQQQQQQQQEAKKQLEIQKAQEQEQQQQQEQEQAKRQIEMHYLFGGMITPLANKTTSQEFWTLTVSDEDWNYWEEVRKDLTKDWKSKMKTAIKKNRKSKTVKMMF